MWVGTAGISLDGPVDGRPGHAEQVGKSGGAVVSRLVQGDQVGFLAGVQLGLLAPQPTFGLGNFHAFSCPKADQVGFELCDHGQYIEQRSPHRIAGVVHHPVEAELDISAGEIVDNCPSVPSDRANRSSLVTTSVSPDRQAARASLRPGRWRLCR